MRVKIAPIAAATAATAVLLTGCGTGSADEPAPEQAAGIVQQSVSLVLVDQSRGEPGLR